MNGAIVDTDVVSMLFKGDSRALDYRSHTPPDGHRRLVIGHFKLETLDHLIMSSIEGYQNKRLLNRRRRDKRIEHVEAVGFCISLEEPVGARPDAVAERYDWVQRQKTVNGRKVPFVSSANDELHGGDL
jgi:hypothetical protein